MSRLKTIKELKNCHNEYITNLRYYYDSLNNQDLVMSISSKDNNLKIWNINNWECILNIDNANKNGSLYSACFLADNNNIYILTSNVNKIGEPEKIKVFNFKGKVIKEINDSNINTVLIDNYFDNNCHKNYILTGNIKCVKSYDFNKNKLYRTFYEKNNNHSHGSLLINSNEEIIKLIESCTDGEIRIWNFHSSLLLSKIKVSDKFLYGICLLDQNHIFVASEDKTIKLIDIKNLISAQSLNGHDNAVLTVKKIMHPKYGLILISQGLNEDGINIWRLKNE